MKTLSKLIIISLLLLWTMGGGVLTAYAKIPHLINYQGRLTATDGSPITATKQITFRIYNVLSGGAPLWEETQPITINKGVFSTMLGSTVDLNLPFDQPYYLEIKIEDEVMTPRQRIASVGYAIRAETADSSIQADNAINADTVDNKHAADFIEQGGSAGGDLTGTYPNPAIAFSAVSQSKLKTATGEISNGGRGAYYTLPGGAYGFYPQRKVSQPVVAHTTIGTFGGRNVNYTQTSYNTSIYIEPYGTGTVYIRQRYITASGQDYWLFLLIDKNTKEILSTWGAPDHNSYGNGGDYVKTPHPFSSYDSNKQYIVLVEKENVKELRKEAREKEVSLLTLINEDYKVNWQSTAKYVPLHSGKFLDETPILIPKLPSYIKMKKLIKFTDAEKLAKEEKKDADRIVREEAKAKKENDLKSAKQKLKTLGLTIDELDAMGIKTN